MLQLIQHPGDCAVHPGDHGCMPSGAVARATQLLDPGARREEFVWFEVAPPHGAVIKGTTIRHDLVGGFLLVDRADDMLQRGVLPDVALCRILYDNVHFSGPCECKEECSDVCHDVPRVDLVVADVADEIVIGGTTAPGGIHPPEARTYRCHHKQSTTPQPQRQTQGQPEAGQCSEVFCWRVGEVELHCCMITATGSNSDGSTTRPQLANVQVSSVRGPAQHYPDGHTEHNEGAELLWGDVHRKTHEERRNDGTRSSTQ